MLFALLDIITYVINLLVAIFIIRMILQILVVFNVVNTYNEFVAQFIRALDIVTEPMLRPIRRIMPDLGGIDFSPTVLIFGLIILQKLIVGVAVSSSAM